MTQELMRVGGFVVGGAIPGLVAVVIEQAALGSGGYPSWIILALAVVVGVGCWLGCALGSNGSAVAPRVPGLGSVARHCALVVALGLGGGAVALTLGTALAMRGLAADYAVLAWLSLVAGACGVVAGRAASQSVLASATTGALYGLLCGYCIPFGRALTQVATQRPCPRGAYCLIVEPVHALLAGAQTGIVDGVWLACVIWCAMGLGLTLAAFGARRRIPV